MQALALVVLVAVIGLHLALLLVVQSKDAGWQARQK
jgi:hypothetical protein